MMNSTAVLESLKQKLFLHQESKVVVVGLGETGYSVVKFLHKYGLKCAVVDSRNRPPLNEALLQHYPDTPVFTGGFISAAFEVATHIVVSPGVSLQEQSIKNALLKQVKLVSDIDLFACATEQPIVAITGSNGKSTVTTLLGLMGDNAGLQTAIGGNLGTPALDLLDDTVELYVLELSSFQLERTHLLNAIAATVLNISADHLDRHDGIDGYAKEKSKVFAGSGVMVLNQDDARVKAMQIEDRAMLTFSVVHSNGFHLQNQEGEDWLMHEGQSLIRKSELALDGLHNVANALAALALGSAIGLSSDAMCRALKMFNGLAHRMQKVAEINGVCWINDSKATNIGACTAALQGYQNKVVLIAGGDAKGADLNQLVPVIKQKVKCIVLIGKDANKINAAIDDSVPAFRADTMKEAVSIAANQAEKGDYVLLSPACASIDQYKNYQERGEQFSTAVMGLVA